MRGHEPKTASPRTKPPRAYARGGLNTLRRALVTSRKRLPGRRFVLGRALWAWLQDLVDALGGPGVVSPQQLTLIDLVVETKLLLDCVTAWILAQAQKSGLVDKRRRALLPVAGSARSWPTAWRACLGQPGPERRVKTRDRARSCLPKGRGRLMAPAGRDEPLGARRSP